MFHTYNRVVEAAADMDEIQVIHPLINFKGIGIKDGNLHEMEEAIKKAYKKAKDICYEVFRWRKSDK